MRYYTTTHLHFCSRWAWGRGQAQHTVSRNEEWLEISIEFIIECFDTPPRPPFSQQKRSLPPSASLHPSISPTQNSQLCHLCATFASGKCACIFALVTSTNWQVDITIATRTRIISEIPRRIWKMPAAGVWCAPQCESNYNFSTAITCSSVEFANIWENVHIFRALWWQTRVQSTVSSFPIEFVLSKHFIK